LRFSRSLLVIVLLFFIITCAYLFEKKQNAHIYFHSEQSDNNNNDDDVSFIFSKNRRCCCCFLLFSVLSFSPLREEEEEEVFRCWRVLGVVLLLIFFLNQKIHKGPQGGTERGKKGESTKEGRKGKKIFEKKKIQLCCSDERERIYSFSTNQISFATERLVVAEQNLSLSRAFPRCLCSFF